MIQSLKNNHDLIELFEYLIALKGIVSKHNHRKYKYRWSVSLENKVLTQLQKLSILQDYQRDRLDWLLVKQALDRQLHK